ncbi:hypothetical protein HC028_26545 [Planosporangium flavigriseum]|nr:hypothetical protein [Planosporangium flavigriseum]NJC68039.1 hypothetical protein [Planosporangium flavigriseum]
MSEAQKSTDQVPSYQVPEAGDIPAEDATSPQVMYARERDQAEGDVEQEDEVQSVRRQRS